jgi:endonuclease/exonuclease/phosphatase family metal-dependent hydrolase
MLSVVLSTLLAGAAAQTTGTFNVLSFNVAGLPAILNGNDVPGDKTTNTASIGKFFTQYGYDIIHVQEDFNYHATLYANDNHPYRTATSGGVPFGSGLNTLSNFYWIDEERTKWDTCSDASGADCLTPKGFTFMRVQISSGIWIDVYNLHADAGTEAADLTARAANLRQVSQHITTYSAGNPVLVFGDTNSRYTRSADVPSIFATDNGMTDAWVQIPRNGVAPTPGAADIVCTNPSETTSCETVDKVFYRGSPAVQLSATAFDYVGDKFLQANGDILSDHNPVLVNFTWSQGQNLRMSDYTGGPHGDFFSDIPTLAGVQKPTISSVTLRGADRLDAISLTLSTGQTFSHGGDGGTAYTLRFNAGESWSKATICQAQKDGQTRVFYMSVTTSQGRLLSAGRQMGDCFTQTAESGWGVVGFVGRDGDEIDRVALVYGKL